MAYKIAFATFIIGLLLGAGLCYKLGSKETTQTQVVDKDQTKDNIKTTTTELIKPDGTKQIVITTLDNSIKTDDTITNTKTVIPIAITTKWHASLGYLRTITDLTKDPIYQLSVEKKVLGSLSLGVTGTTDKQLGLVIGFDF